MYIYYRKHAVYLLIIVFSTRFCAAIRVLAFFNGMDMYVCMYICVSSCVIQTYIHTYVCTYIHKIVHTFTQSLKMVYVLPHTCIQMYIMEPCTNSFLGSWSRWRHDGGWAAGPCVPLCTSAMYAAPSGNIIVAKHGQTGRRQRLIMHKQSWEAPWSRWEQS